jgi:hypothetical protein
MACGAVKSTFQLPTQLLYISKDLKVRLCLSDEYDRTCYATLSHCWGGTKRLVLEYDRLEDFRIEIPETALYETFKDAIVLAGVLVLQYLWIDSLCIIQDKFVDWKIEAGQMTDIYRGCTVSIAASGAFNGDGGCKPDVQSLRCSGFKP